MNRWLVLWLMVVSAECHSAEQWRQLDAENLVYLETDDGRVIIELNPVFAPKTSAQFQRLVREGFYNDEYFYRVIDGFVAQGGDGSDLNRELSQATLPAEFERTYSENDSFISVQTNDLFAPETGFVNGFAAARDPKTKKVWLTHCPGVVAMARDNDPNSGSTDFYIVIGQAPRYLDRNLTIFGRVIVGMDTVQKIKRGPKDNNGVILETEKQTRINKIRMGTDVLKEERMAISVMNTNHDEFKALLDSRRNRSSAFFHYQPPAVLDVCQVPLPTRLEEL